MLVAASGLMLREGNGFQAIRRVLSASRGLASHSLMVSFMSMGLVRQVLGADPSVVLEAGLAGMLHDVGKVGHEQLDHDPEHTTRGHDQLHALGLSPAVCDAALYHHERFDGSGFPRGLVGAQIPELARVVGLVNTFDKVFSNQTPPVGVFDALRIVAQAYRGCFEEGLAQGFVKLFRS